MLRDTSLSANNPLNHTYLIFHNWRQNPLLAELATGFGRNYDETVVVSTTDQTPLKFTTAIGFNVWETKGFESSLDIYYETTTCGLISELNSETTGSSSTALPTSIKFNTGPNHTGSFEEGLISPSVVGGGYLETRDQNDALISNSNMVYTVVKVQKGQGNVVDTTGNLFFGINTSTVNQPKIQITNNKFYFNDNQDYIVTIEARNTSTQATTRQDFTFTINNTTPSLTLPGTASHPHFSSGAIQIFIPSAKSNGTSDTTRNTDNITFSISKVTFDPSGVNQTTNTHKNKFNINSINGAVGMAGHVFPSSEIGKVYRVFVQIDDNTGETNATSEEFCDVTIGAWAWMLNADYATGFNGICPAWCGNHLQGNFYITRPPDSNGNTDPMLNPQAGDLVYFDSAMTQSVSSAFVITNKLSGFANNSTGLYTRVISGSIQSVDNDVLCENYQC